MSDDLKKRLVFTLKELEEARNQLLRHPQWGNCKRGCPPAYLINGFCSPACELGAPRGELVTLAKPSVTTVTDRDKEWDADQGNGFNSRGYEAGRGIYHDPMG